MQTMYTAHLLHELQIQGSEVVGFMSLRRQHADEPFAFLCSGHIPRPAGLENVTGFLVCDKSCLQLTKGTLNVSDVD